MHFVPWQPEKPLTWRRLYTFGGIGAVSGAAAGAIAALAFGYAWLFVSTLAILGAMTAIALNTSAGPPGPTMT